MVTEPSDDDFGLDDIDSVAQYAAALRQLRRRDAGRRGQRQHSYRAIGEGTDIPYTTIGPYFSGKRLVPSGSSDLIVVFLGASPAEQKAFATTRDRVEEHLRAQRSEPSAEDRQSTASQPEPDTAPASEAIPDGAENGAGDQGGNHPATVPRRLAVLLAAAAVAVLAGGGGVIYLLTGHYSVDPDCGAGPCVYLHKADAVTLWTSASTDSAPVRQVPNKTAVTMICWTDAQPVRRPNTNYPSGRWFKVTADNATGFVPSGTVFNQAEVRHC